MNEFLTSVLSSLGLAWWVEITTENPRCTYYFGPFPSLSVAQSHKGGYVEDLQNEGAQNITVTVKRCKPNKLTIYDDRNDPVFKPIPGVLSSQF
jgi:hypothetical protein